MRSADHQKPSAASRHSRHASLYALNYPPELPITEKREEIVRAINEHQVVVITGETGSGKSTQIPKMCLEAGRGVGRLIGCTQPRRIAAITLAQRVAEEMGVEGPRLVGYKIRFQDRTAASTRIKFMTDGMLLAEAQKDRTFRAYDTIIVDEAHERSLNIDFLLGLVKRILPRRPDLKVIVTSATIDPDKFSQAFGGAPILEVSGRTYPVSVRYRPVDEADEEEGGLNYLDQTIAAVDELKSGFRADERGDILIFMPTESDIRETVQRLEEKRYRNTLVLPLFGRMAAADQQRVFRLTSEEKIVVATNVAETSVTIPRIKFVIDTGLARISQYNARSRTQSLPVAPVSRASADQRKGRCGRVQSGICVRLYAESDYQGRPLYTAPEIQRSNLAEVILRMLFLGLGSVQNFPFLDPPSPAAVKDGFAVLQELSAVDDHRRLTPLGRMMARLPLDPRLARMLVEANKEGALREVMILVAALSIQDPRERPLEQETQADQVHAQFRDRRSDFVSLLKIWQGYEQQQSGPRPSSQSQMRKFCREHFLSYRRMREWRDIHQEVQNILVELGEFIPEETPASYEAIHRSILSGYLSHIALRKEKNLYLAARNRQVMIFPGSGLFNKGGGWIVAAEMVQTSRLFARTVAGIEPQWLEALGRHLCRRSYSEPHWERKRGQVVAYERVTLYGLPIVERRKVDYSKIRPQEAREIFIRSALVEGDLPGSFGFMEHNRQLIQQIQDLESKTRRRDLLVDEETLFHFYEQRLPDFADLRSFQKFLKEQGSDAVLCMTERDLLRAQPDFEALEQFPDILPLQDFELPLRYAFHPGEEDDGVTVTIPVHALSRLHPDPFEWLVPGMFLEQVTLLLKALPKSLRRQLVPVGDTAQLVLRHLRFREGNLYLQLSNCLQQLKGVEVAPDQWDKDALPVHLRMRCEVVGPEGNALAAGRNLEELRSVAVAGHDDRLWDSARTIWEREGITAWDFEQVPHQIALGKDALGLERFAYPGLSVQGETVAIRLFDDPEKARGASRKGLMLLYQLVLASELRMLKKDWVFPEAMAAEIFFMGSRKAANQRLQQYLMRELFGIPEHRFSAGWPDRRQFQERVQELRGSMGLLAQEMITEVSEVLKEREKCRCGLQRFMQMAKGNAGMLERLQVLSGQLEKLVPGSFAQTYRRLHVQQLPRYIRALQIRVERAYVAPEKDRLKAEQLEYHSRRLEELRDEVLARPTDAGLTFLDELRWMLEEFKISLFAPEIKTRFRVSPKRFEEKYQEWPSWKGKIG